MKKRCAVLIFVAFFVCSPVSAHADEMFEHYAKNFAVGYDSSPLIRYWFSESWGMDIRPNYRASRDTNDDVMFGTGVRSDRQSGTYYLQVDGVYQVKSFSYADYNLLLGARYQEEYSTATDTFYSSPVMVNSSSSRSHEWSILFGPEVEIKVPYFSRLKVSASILAQYSLLKSRYSSTLPSSIQSRRFFPSTATGIHWMALCMSA